MVDDIAKIEPPLFQITPVKKVREVTPRPQDRRHGRDTYLESDEVGLEVERDEIESHNRHNRGDEVRKKAHGHPENDESHEDEGPKKDKDHLLDVIA